MIGGIGNQQDRHTQQDEEIREKLRQIKQGASDES